MFTGIIEEVGTVKKISRRALSSTFYIEATRVLSDTKIGDSIAVNGACLTVIRKEANLIVFDVVPETLRIANLGKLRIGEKVNLERSLKAGGRVSGHFVLGHVDCIGVIRKKAYIKGGLCFEIAVPPDFLKYVFSKGSVAIDGISLTIAEISRGSFKVYIIPHTLKNTNLSLRAPSDKVNIEFDILAKKAVSLP